MNGAAQRVESAFDFRNPDYAAVYVARMRRLTWLRAKPGRVESIKTFYATNPVQFIEDFGCSADPRLAARGLPVIIPLVLMPRQREMLTWMIELWRNNEPGLLEKSRDCGASVLSMALACTLCLFNKDMMIGFGSAKEDKLDRTGDPSTLFFKGRTFMQYLPVEFRGGWLIDKHAPFMRMLFPGSRSSITGESGDNIGRGGRLAIMFLDESAHLEHPELVDASLLATTDCRIDMSSVNGMNAFAMRRHSGNVKVFTFHYRDDLRKDEQWAERKRATIDPVIWNAEYELNYTASVEGIIIPQQWVQAAIDAHKKLNLEPSGERLGALDVADEGRDKNAFASRHGQLVTSCQTWSGKDSDIFATAEKAFLLCDELQLQGYVYDADGLGAGIRGDSTRIKVRRVKQGLQDRSVAEFRGSAAVFMPEQLVAGTDRTAKDFFANHKAQSWWHLKTMFQHTFRAVNKQEHDPEYLISLDSGIPDLQKLCIELSQPQWKLSVSGKMLVDKTPDGIASPNMADAIMMLFAPRSHAIRISDDLLNDDGLDDWDLE